MKRYSRWIQNERIEYDCYYLPFVQELLYRLAEIRELVFIIDGSEGLSVGLTAGFFESHSHDLRDSHFLIIKTLNSHLRYICNTLWVNVV